jgi:outer membrane lipoprotein SlyB
MNVLTGWAASVVVMAVGMTLAGCAGGPHHPVDKGYDQRDGPCHSCGVVQDVRQVDPGSGASGVVIGAAVAAGVPGGQAGSPQDGSGAAWRIVVRMDNGQYASATQRESFGIRNGDYVGVRHGRVYAR